MKCYLLSFLGVFFCLFASAQTPDATDDEESTAEKQQSALELLAAEISDTNKELEELKTARSKLQGGEERDEANQSITETDSKLNQLQTEFISVAANVDLSSVNDAMNLAPLTLSGELTELLRPIVEEVKEATSGPRDMEALNNKINEARKKQESAASIVAALEKRKALSKNAYVLDVIDEALVQWNENAGEAKLKLEVLEFQLADLNQRSVPILESLSEAVKSFFRNRGLHLLLAIMAFMIILCASRKTYRYFRKISPLHRKKGRSLSTRIMDLSSIVLGFLFALFGAVLVLYFANDWLLLTLVLLFFVGLIWVSKQALPKVIEQAKLMLNLGAVREGERIIYDGLPWKVKRINVYTDLTNPALDGGVRRLPIKDLLDLRSRVSDEEGWFPCNKGEWVLLSDETFGRVVAQTPEFVEIIRLGGARKFFPTSSFLEMTPLNLSRNFRVSSVFGIDYDLQGISTTEVAPIFEQRISKELAKTMDNDLIKNVCVQFKSAGASSLDYEIMVDFAGGAAPQYNKLQRTLQSICVDVCNEQGWGIPFTQITLHQAAAE